MNTATATPDKAPVVLTFPPRAGYKLELVPGEFTGTWKDALAWAKEQGGDLPTREESLALYREARSEFSLDHWYWTSEQHASNPGYAWMQLFGGYQYCFHQGVRGRARAVRRVPL